MTDTAPESTAVDAAGGHVPGRITLDYPIEIGGETVTQLTIRKPAAGELRGLKLVDLSQLEFGTIETLLPRITTPRLTKQDVARLDPADLMQAGAEVMDFLLPKDAKPASPAS